ncbi:uncharacterized protein LY79DRAFT_199616 [Colletotrichum navitas]|uniref:Uncharacterized protein n=1 Tax=Colletotrichum navitas TaxID=681940 RepID=A0AAD8V510_9PEZI|nr:uncharacterized protein LY79DRAFT_199616 [Colletotrichum navitas]KAK1590761.1 hypothetical protein LY79DRAFT_199616 [Colletotrichum navitas]
MGREQMAGWLVLLSLLLLFFFFFFAWRGRSLRGVHVSGPIPGLPNLDCRRHRLSEGLGCVICCVPVTCVCVCALAKRGCSTSYLKRCISCADLFLFFSFFSFCLSLPLGSSCRPLFGSELQKETTQADETGGGEGGQRMWPPRTLTICSQACDLHPRFLSSLSQHL